MTSRRLRFFATPNELAPILAAEAERSGDTLTFRTIVTVSKVAIGQSRDSLTTIEPRRLAEQRWGQWDHALYLGAVPATHERIDMSRMAELSLIQLTLPHLTGDTLFMAEMYMRSDWVDPNGERHTNRACEALFRRYRAALMPHLTGGLEIYVPPNGLGRPEKELASADALSLQRAGGYLRQFPGGSAAWRPRAN